MFLTAPAFAQSIILRESIDEITHGKVHDASRSTGNMFDSVESGFNVVDNDGRPENHNIPTENKQGQDTTSCPAMALFVGAVVIFFLVGGYYEFKKKGYSLKKFK